MSAFLAKVSAFKAAHPYVFYGAVGAAVVLLVVGFVNSHFFGYVPHVIGRAH